MKKQILFALFAGSLRVLCAQTDLQTAFLDPSSAMLIQPAAIATSAEGATMLNASGAFMINSNTIKLGSFLANGNNLTPQVKNDIISKLEEDNRLQLASAMGGGIAHKGKKWAYGVSYRQVRSVLGRFNNPQTAMLILNGNAQFAGKSISDNGISLRSQTYHEVGLNLAKSFGNLHVGIRPKVIIGKRATVWNFLDYSLFTAEDGTEVDLSANYELNKSNKGMGAAIDVGFIYQLTENVQLSGAANDLGFVRWKGTGNKSAINFSYTGIDLNQILQGSNTSNLFGTDTLNELFFPDTSDVSFNTTTPISLRAAIDYKMSPNGHIVGQLYYGVSKYAPSMPLPLVQVMYQHKWIVKQWGIEAGAGSYVLGMDGFGVGFMAALNRSIGRNKITFFYAMDNLLATLGAGKGLALNGGLTYTFGATRAPLNLID